MPRASKKTKKKKAVEIRYEPPPSGIKAIVDSTGLFVNVWNDRELCAGIWLKDISKVIDELARLEKSLYYEKVINDAIHK